MEIRRYTTYHEAEVLSLYRSVGWTVYADNPAMVKAAFAGSLLVLGAFVQDELIGLIRAVGDGASILYIQDILVAPEYQRKGVGRRLLQAMLAQYPSIYQTVLMTDNIPERAAFYRACGFTAVADMGCCAFIRMLGR